MKPEEQRIAIAETCGWTLDPPTVEGLRKWSLNGCKLNGGPPDYLSDLNAMNGAEKVLTLDQTRDYLIQLESVTSGRISAFLSTDGAMHVALVVHATAPQRAEAFLKTLNLWKP